MIKKISIYFILIFFSTNVVAQDLIMKCGEHTYKYISDPNGDKVLCIFGVMSLPKTIKGML